MLKITGISVNGAFLKGDSRYRSVDSRSVLFGWKADTNIDSDVQKSFELKLSTDEELIWEHKGKGVTQNYRASLPELPAGVPLYITVTVVSEAGDEDTYSDYFYYANPVWNYPWIGMADRQNRKALYFSKKIDIKGEIANAYMYYCGLGYSVPFINGLRISDARMDPAHSDYSKKCYYVMETELEEYFTQGENTVEFTVGDGWRVFDSPFLLGFLGVRRPSFAGEPGLSACIRIEYTDGTADEIITGDDWNVSYGPITECSIYDGETYDANMSEPEFVKASFIEGPQGKMALMDIPPVMPQEEYAPVSAFRLGDCYILDFGQNMAGVLRVRLPENLRKGQKITLAFAEVTDDNGDIYTAPLRDAKCTDTYIASGDGNDLEEWQAEFTYHGFRYVKVSGLESVINPDDFTAVALYTDLDETGTFESGSALLNTIHYNCVMTEKSNIHSIMTDCPQRDERLGWMNDATVRFESTPYSFDLGRMLSKIAGDILDVQGDDGSITCTAPFVVGCRPADPVCSSYLVSVMQSYLRTGNKSTLAKYYDGLRRWEECLLKNSTDYIVNYTYYGDWASPAFACRSFEDANSKVTPGILMSTGFSYYNCILLGKIALKLGLTGDYGKFTDISRKIRKAFLDKWLDKETGKVAEGSQASQSFALWLGLIPDEIKEKSLEILHNDLAENSYRITTGNLCTRYMLEVLSANGYVNDAYRIMTSENYPGFGYMIQNEATTIWERFELKKEPGMNSHNHPMYASCDRWFYACILGIEPGEDGWNNFTVKPKLPDGLLSAMGGIDSPYGRISVRWTVKYGKKTLYLTVPFGTSAEVEFEGQKAKFGAGSYIIVSEQN